MPRKNPLSHLTSRVDEWVARLSRHWRWIMMIGILIPGGLLFSSSVPRPLAQPLEANGITSANGIMSEEPITPIPAPGPIDP